VRWVAAVLGVSFIGPGDEPRGRAVFNRLHCCWFQSLKGRGNEVTVATIQKRELKEGRNGSNPVSMACGEGDGRHGADRRWRLHAGGRRKGEGTGGPVPRKRSAGHKEDACQNVKGQQKLILILNKFFGFEIKGFKYF
jgi:hypothetical protein